MYLILEYIYRNYKLICFWKYVPQTSTYKIKNNSNTKIHHTMNSYLNENKCVFNKNKNKLKLIIHLIFL